MWEKCLRVKLEVTNSPRVTDPKAEGKM